MVRRRWAAPEEDVRGKRAQLLAIGPNLQPAQVSPPCDWSAGR